MLATRLLCPIPPLQAPYEFLEITSVPSTLTADGDPFDVSIRFRIHPQDRNMRLKVSFKSAAGLIDQARVALYNDFDIILGHFTCTSQPHRTPHATWAVLHFVPVLIGC